MSNDHAAEVVERREGRDVKFVRPLDYFAPAPREEARHAARAKAATASVMMGSIAAILDVLPILQARQSGADFFFGGGLAMILSLAGIVCGAIGAQSNRRRGLAGLAISTLTLGGGGFLLFYFLTHLPRC